MSKKIRVAIAGVGNCASALLQGLVYYKNHDSSKPIPGVMNHIIGGYTLQDIEVVAAFDVDQRKVGRPLGEAIYALPNCSREFAVKRDVIETYSNVVVQKSPTLDGIPYYTTLMPEDFGFRPDTETPDVNVAEVLKSVKADVLINYLPVGSRLATEYLAEACLESKTSFMNCIPEFIVSRPEWEQRFYEAGIPAIGDDMRSQCGTSVISQIMQEMLIDRGAMNHYVPDYYKRTNERSTDHAFSHHIQMNIGGSKTDWSTLAGQQYMIAKLVKEGYGPGDEIYDKVASEFRLGSKKESKENVIKSQYEIRGLEAPEYGMFAGPAMMFPRALTTEKIGHIEMKGNGWGGAPIRVFTRLEIEDDANSAGVVADAIRCLAYAKDIGIAGAVYGGSAFTQKTPPRQYRYGDAAREMLAFAESDIDYIKTKTDNKFIK